MKKHATNNIKDNGVYVLISPLEISILKNINENKNNNNLKQNLIKHKQRKIRKAYHQLHDMGLINYSKSKYCITDDGKRALKNYKPFPKNNRRKKRFFLKFACLILIILFIIGLVSLVIKNV